MPNTTIELTYIVDWLNYWLKHGLPLATLIEQRVDVPLEVEDVDDFQYPLILSEDAEGTLRFGALGLLSSLAESTGHRVARCLDDNDRLVRFELALSQNLAQDA